MSLRTPTELRFSAANMAAEWARWKRDWLYYAAARELSEKPAPVQIGTFFNYAGVDAQEVASHFEWQEEDGLPALLEKFEAYCNPRRNIVLERFNFHARIQQPGETITAFLAALRSLIATCDFPDPENMIRDRLVTGVADRATQRALLRQADLTLTAAVDIALSEEASHRDQQCMAGAAGDAFSAREVNASSLPSTAPGTREVSAISRPSPVPGAVQCRFCARAHVMQRSRCPAWGKSCHNCGGRNHFSACCDRPAESGGGASSGQWRNDSRWQPRSAAPPVPASGTRRSADSYRSAAQGGGRRDGVAAVEETDQEGKQVGTESEDPLYAVNVVQASGAEVPFPSRVFKTLVSPSGQPVQFLVDSGFECNIVSLSDYERATGDVSHQYLQKGVSALRMYDGTLVSTLGKASLRLVNPSSGQRVMLKCRVVDKSVMPIISLISSVDLGLIDVKDVDPLDYVPRGSADEGPTEGLTRAGVMAEFEQVFDASKPGRVIDEYSIVTDPQISPVAEAPRRVRVHVRDRLKSKVDDLVAQGLISPVTEPTPWVSNLVIVDKPNGDLRLCLDPKSLNKAIQREHYPTPTLDEVSTRLSEAKVFSVVDASQAFWQIGLTDESARLCTFHTPFGRYRWEVLPYGIKSAPEVWQRAMHDLIAGLRGVEVIADDFIVFGKTEQDHDANLRAFLCRAAERNLRLNPEKFRFKVEEVKWMGHILSSQGLKCDPARISAIAEFPVPTSVPELKRFLGMVGYLSRFLPNISAVLAPLRQLTQRTVAWYWSESCQRAFERVIGLLTSAPVLSFYDPSLEATVQCDASMSGLGACLLQEGKPVIYCSRALTTAEKAYSQIEKELLAITFALTRLDQFLYARPVTVVTDHKPLVAIQSKPLGDAPLRLQRMLMTLQRYDYLITYQPGSQLCVADTLSRASLPLAPDVFAVQLETVDLSQGVSVSPDRLALICTATAADPVLSALMAQIQRGWPDRRDAVPAEIRCFFPFRDELTTQGGLIFKYRCLVVPASQQREVLSQLHRSHIGLASIVRLARESVFWVGMQAQLREAILKCPTCLAHRPSPAREPLQSHDVPSRPWQVLATDLFELNGQAYSVLVDYYSNYVEVDQLPCLSSAQVIRVLSTHFARFGIPEVLVSDNGPQYASAEFADFTRHLDIEHRTSSPTYPQANGKAENAVRTVKSLFRKALASGENPLWALLMWRNAPSETTGVSPAQLMFGRPCRTFLPTARSTLAPAPPVPVHQARVKAQQTQADYFNRGTRPLRALVEGETVRMRLPGRSTWSPGVCLRSAGDRSYLVRVDNYVYRRNRRHLLATNEDPNMARDLSERPCVPHPPPLVSLGNAVSRPEPPHMPPSAPEAVGEGEVAPRNCHGRDGGDVCASPTPSPPTPRRSGRVSQPPPYLRDYVR